MFSQPSPNRDVCLYLGKMLYKFDCNEVRVTICLENSAPIDD